MRERVPQVFDNVERHRHVQSREHARRSLGVDPRDDGIEFTMHQMNARADARSAVGKARIARGEGDDGARDARRLHCLERHRAALRIADQHRTARRHAEVDLLAAH